MKWKKKVNSVLFALTQSPIPNPQSTIPNPQSSIHNPQSIYP